MKRRLIGISVGILAVVALFIILFVTGVCFRVEETNEGVPPTPQISEQAPLGLEATSLYWFG